MTAFQIWNGDCLEILDAMEPESVDAICTDPPYGLSREPDISEVLTHWLAGDDYQHRGGGFMGHAWDSFVPGPAVWRACLRVLRPGGHLLAFGGTRTADLLTIALRLAGFQIRDRVLTLAGESIGAELSWVYGSGWPKNRDLSDAQPGWGTALKPAHEPVIVARKPCEGTVEQQVRATGTGAFNIDGCRIASGPSPSIDRRQGSSNHIGSRTNGWRDARTPERYAAPRNGEQLGRWPANLILTHHPECVEVGEREICGDARAGTDTVDTGRSWLHEAGPQPGGPVHGDDIVPVFDCVPGCPVAELERQSGSTGGHAPFRGTEPSAGRQGNTYGSHEGRSEPSPFYADKGSAARFFYCAKASTAERNAGLDGMPLQEPAPWSKGTANPGSFQSRPTPPRANIHPTVKPIAVMQWLTRLVTPAGGTVLDPFCGSGTTGCAAVLEGFTFVGIEIDPVFATIAEHRCKFWDQFPAGTTVDAVLGEEGDRRRRRTELEERRRASAAVGQLDLLSGSDTT
jgi:DNA modification methylase